MSILSLCIDLDTQLNSSQVYSEPEYSAVSAAGLTHISSTCSDRFSIDRTLLKKELRETGSLRF
ncbi:hypothetical protein A3206_08415 [Candidatus Methanomassiliicoccus intestinalis]|uniref:Uncharacterized protein n=1 Tax=Methanomassiliicoccus intestinalis (strain Issoire-Mx1) TaxID=1295009 RepID=R9T6D6_METII|nr:hypothetical protein MMINT_12220 [Candidatus Methanomassiliicoccus intestinalis Issoire-Mx1]TQS84188.1 MAG: hypothetical protein A3206_08415 [Candidatus Methanomassiliicoccus intestinalis]